MKTTKTSLLVAIVLLSSATAFAANGENARMVMPRPAYRQARFTVEAHGNTKVTPRWGHTSVSLQKTANTRAEALRLLNQQANPLERRLKSTLGKHGSIETSRVNVQKEYANGAYTGRFTATKSIELKARTSKTGLDKLGKAIEAAASADANVGGQYFRTDPSQVTRAQGTAKSRALKSAETQAKRLAKTAGLNPATVQLVEVTPIGAQTGGFATRSLALESVSRGGSADQQTNLTVNKQDVSAGLQAVFTASTGRLQPFPGPIGPIRPLHQADGQQ